MDDKEQISVARRIQRKLRDLEVSKSTDFGSSQSPKNKKKTGKSSIIKFVRSIFILAVTTTIVAVVILTSTNAFKKRQQDMDRKVETPIVEEAHIQVSHIDFKIMSEAGSKILKVSAIIKNTGNTAGTIGRAKFEAFDLNMESITEWPSPLLMEPISPGDEQMIESSFVEPPGEVFSVELILERVFSQKR